jgi:thioredoxin 1
MPEISITSLEQFKSLTETSNAIVRYTATWCGPCRRIEPEVKLLSNNKYEPHVNFLSIDLDEAQDVKELNVLLQNVNSVPTFRIYKEGKQIDQFSGANIIKLKEKLSSLAQIKVDEDEEKHFPSVLPEIIAPGIGELNRFL